MATIKRNASAQWSGTGKEGFAQFIHSHSS